MTWSIQHITSSSQFLHCNAHAEKAVQIVQQIYAKADDVKLALLLLETTPIAKKDITYEASANVFFGRQLKAHLLILRCHKSACIHVNDESASPEVDSKYGKDQSVWI